MFMDLKNYSSHNCLKGAKSRNVINLIQALTGIIQTKPDRNISYTKISILMCICILQFKK